jgi:membrane protease YdiL (CAAX protease family)
MIKNKITPLKAFLIFATFSAYFFLLILVFLPFLRSNFLMNPAVYWFITGYFLFIPLFVYAVMMVKKEGNKGMNQIISALNIRPLNKKDWMYSIVGLFLTFFCTGLIFGGSFLLNKYFGIRMLNTQPSFIKMNPFQGIEKLLLLVWLPMFFFNIVGEEILWRGYIQSRLSIKNSWLLSSFLWMIFHLTFGMDFIIMLIPIFLIVPYCFYKTKNTLVGIFIHGVYNGPLFIAIALGLIASMR